MTFPELHVLIVKLSYEIDFYKTAKLLISVKAIMQRTHFYFLTIVHPSRSQEGATEGALSLTSMT